MISMYEINLTDFLHRFILHGIRPVVEIFGMFSTDLRPEKKKGNTSDDPLVGKVFVVVQTQRLTGFCQ